MFTVFSTIIACVVEFICTKTKKLEYTAYIQVQLNPIDY